tara:strand:+ start:722 stop:1294 length:573 start_codon:yes stop_codon:yes gene_type:complete
MKKTTYIKIGIAIYTLVLFSLKSEAQGFKNLDEVPHDISYYRESRVSPPLVKVLYGRPNAANEQVFGNEVPFGEVWRTGANEATEIKLYEDVILGDTHVSAGTYVLITIPGEKEWEIILNSNLDVWGAFQYDPSADVAKIRVPVSKAENLEAFSIAFKKVESQILMVLGWGSTRVKVPLDFEEKVYFAKL